EDAVIEAALDPLLVAFHQLSGLGLVGGKSERHDKHPTLLPKMPRQRRDAAGFLRAAPGVHDVSQSHISSTSRLMNVSSRNALASVATPWLRARRCIASASASASRPSSANCRRSQVRNSVKSWFASPCEA